MLILFSSVLLALVISSNSKPLDNYNNYYNYGYGEKWTDDRSSNVEIIKSELVSGPHIVFGSDGQIYSVYYYRAGVPTVFPMKGMMGGVDGGSYGGTGVAAGGVSPGGDASIDPNFYLSGVGYG